MLNFDIPTIIFEIINFLVLTALLYYLLFRPIQRRVNQRAKEKRRQEEEIARKLEEAESMREELENRLAHIDDQITEIIGDAQERMEEIRQTTINNARQEAERILKAANSEAGQLQEKAVSDHMDEILEAIREVSQQVIRQTTPEEVHNQLVKELNERIWQLGSGEMDQVQAIRRSLDQRSPTVFADTAREMSDAQVQELRDTLSALIDKEVDLEISIDKDLISGLQVRVGDTLINNSLSSKLNKILDDADSSIRERMENA